MKSTWKLSTGLALVALAALPAAMHGEIKTVKPAPAPVPGCHHKGVAVHTYYGKAADLQRYLGDLSATAISSRLQIMVVETGQGSQVHVFEQVDGRNYQVSSWKGRSVEGLRADWDQKILASRGSSCAGMDLKADLESRGMPLVAGGNVEHLTASGTFLPMVNGASGYMRVTLLHPCD